MPRILRIINRLNLGGPTYNAAYLSRYLAPEFETMLVAGIKEETEESSEFIVTQMGLSPVYIPSMRREINFKRDREAYLHISKLIREFKPDIVHTHAAKAGTLGRLAAHHNKVPVIIHTFHGHVFHSYFSPLKTSVFKYIEKYLSSISTGIIAISDIQKKELVEQFRVAPDQKTTVIPLGFDLTRFASGQPEKRANFRSAYNLHPETIAIGIIGRLVPVKNHSLFIQALKNLKAQTRYPFRAFIIGDGEDRMKLEQLTLSSGLTLSTPEATDSGADVVFTSWIMDIDRALDGLDIVAMTSLNEGTPVSLIEAQAAGKPIVTTEVGGIRNVVIPEVSALLSPSEDLEQFSRNLIRLTNDAALRTNMSGAGAKHVSAKFGFERLVSDTRALYHELLVQS
ncbi:MAG TPA: glycosyltransferase [Bacteroidia bacterium]|nr:glycosyltransferase [Bacteroidia bacterium]